MLTRSHHEIAVSGCCKFIKYNRIRMTKISMSPKYAIGCACLISAGIASAAVPDDSSAPALRLGGVSVYPGISVVEKRDDNIFSSNINKQSSLVSVSSPSVLLQAKTRADAYSLSYRGDVGRYKNSPADNFIDNSFLGAAEFSGSTSANGSLSLNHRIGHDDRGSTFGPGTPKPNTWSSTGGVGTFIYGAEDARGKVVLDAGYQNRKYKNNRTVTTAYDKTLRDTSAALHIRVMPKTFLILQAADTRIDYVDTASTLNGNERRYLFGATWNVTTQTSGIIKIGQLQKKFDSTIYPTFKGSSWEGSVRWSPIESARVSLVSGRKPSESTGVGNFMLITSHAMDLGFQMSESASLHFNTAKTSEEFKGVARTDSTRSYGVKAEYKLRNWLVGALEYTAANKTSTDLTAYYDRKIVAASVRFGL